MKGKPLLRIALVLLFLMAVLWPVFRVTEHPRVNPPPVPQQKPEVQSGSITSSLRATLLLHAAPSPLHCSVSQRGVILLNESNCIAPGEYRANVEIAKGEDFLITGSWQDEDPHALRVEVLVHGYQSTLEKSFWAQRTLEDTLPIPDSFLP